MNHARILTTEMKVDYEKIILTENGRRYIEVRLQGSNILAMNADSMKSDIEVIRIYITDVNENPQLIPVVNGFKVMENRVAQEVGRIQAQDPENDKVQFKLVSEEDNEYFEIESIDGKEGIIKTRIPLDREGSYMLKEQNERNTYRIKVVAEEIEDNSKQSHPVEYKIEVEDENDNGPLIITNPEYGEDDYTEDNYISRLYSCQNIPTSGKMSDLSIWDPDKKSEGNQGGINGQLYQFHDLEGKHL